MGAHFNKNILILRKYGEKICIFLIIFASVCRTLFGTPGILVLLAFGWSTFAATAFLSECQPAKRKALAMYPILLFYFIISWLVISHTHH